MAETPSTLSPPLARPQSVSGLDFPQYWCYHCDKRVAVETLPDLPDVICSDCKNGFVESISAVALPTPASSADPSLGNQFIQVLRLIAQAAREEDAPPPLPSDPSDEDYLGIEPDGWGNENDDDENEVNRAVEVVHEEDDATDYRSDGEEEDGIDVVDPSEAEDDDEDKDEDEDENENEDEARQTRRDILRLSLRDIVSRAANRRNTIMDWADLLMGLEDSIELRLQDTYVGNPGDYVNAAEYEALLQNLADSDSGAKRGSPPAAKAAVEGLQSMLVEKEEDVIVCAICKETVSIGDIAKNLPCRHGYHIECIVPWLGSRNTCPVCRFELPTDDPDYEEERKKMVVVGGLRAASSGSSSGDDSGFE